MYTPKSNMELHAIPEVYIYIVCVLTVYTFIVCIHYSIIQYDDLIICIYLCIHAGYMSVDIQYIYISTCCVWFHPKQLVYSIS